MSKMAHNRRTSFMNVPYLRFSNIHNLVIHRIELESVFMKVYVTGSALFTIEIANCG